MITIFAVSRTLTIALPLALALFLSLRPESSKAVIIGAWILCFLVLFSEYRFFINRKSKKDEEEKSREYYHNLCERQDLRGRHVPLPYHDGLGENPSLKQFFISAQKHEEKYRFSEAINEYRKCLSHSEATLSNKTASHVLIGSCYYSLSALQEAGEHYIKALELSKK
jgi:tetratricopeptide (TPR) repeat protein